MTTAQAREELHMWQCIMIAPRKAVPGDILLSAPATRLIHLAVRSFEGIVEAHAGLRRVVERPLGSDERWDSCWRLPIGDI
jgi:hypothetical protein